MRFKRLLLAIIFLYHLLLASFAQEPTLLDHGGGVRTLEFSPVNASLIASAGESNLIKLWNLQNDTVQTLRGHTGIVNAVAFSPNGELLASVSDDRTIKLWNVRTQQNIATLQEGTQFRSVAFSPDGQLLATGGGMHVKLWDVRRRVVRATLQHNEWVLSVAFSLDGQLLAAGDGSGDGPGTVKVWDVKSRQVVVSLNANPKDVKAVEFSPDDLYLAGSGWNGHLKIWDVSNWNLLRTIPNAGHYDIAFSPDAKMLVADLNIWWVEDGTRVAELTGSIGWRHPVDFSHDGASLAVGGEDGIVRLWRIDTSPVDGREEGAVQILHTDTYFQQLPEANSANGDNIPEPVPPPAIVRDFFQLDPFYQQWINVKGFPVLASEEVSPYAVKETAYLIDKMIGHRLDMLRVFAQNKERFSIVGYDQGITQIPEYSYLQPDFYVDIRSRGFGAADLNLTTSTSEENLLEYPEDPYDGLNVFLHELAHTVHERGMNKMDPGFDDRLKMIYEAALTKGLWENTYAAVNHKEYWAEGSEAWFNPKTTSSFDRFGDTREDLKAYDPELAALITEVYGDGEWRYTLPTTRLHESHLQGFDPQNSPTFQWPPDKVALHKVFTSDPESTGDGRWVNLEAYPPSELPRLQASRREGEPTIIVIGNFGIDDIFAYLITPDGTEHFFDRVRSDMKNYNTSVGALWLLKDKNGEDLWVYRAEAEIGRVLFLREEEIDNSPQVKIPDANLAAAVRETLGLVADTPITERAMQRLTTLIAVERQITDLTGLEHATELVRLSAWENQIQDVSPLSKLTQLQELHLQANQITDITTFSGLTELKHLHLWGNQIRDISALAELTKLESLWLAGNPIEDKAPLHKLLEQNPDMELDIEVVGVGASPTTVAEIPTQTALLANYPNPFNPETWIPYQLSKPAEVTLRIYAVDGTLIRTLALGYQPAGMYHSRTRAAYWDGKNEAGETVASGVYFYTFSAGDFTSTRKMLIRK